MTGRDGQILWHFSENAAITEFQPRPMPGNPEVSCVWAVDDAHAPAYWFPRDCPRVTCWPGDTPPSPAGASLLAGAGRVHAIEWAWLPRLRDTTLYRYAMPVEPFRVSDAAAGYHVAEQPVRPLRVEPVGDLLATHAAAGIELRLTSSLWTLSDAVVVSGLAFSMIRMRNAVPRP